MDRVGIPMAGLEADRPSPGFTVWTTTRVQEEREGLLGPGVQVPLSTPWATPASSRMPSLRSLWGEEA